MFAVLPMAVVAALFFWGGIAILGVALTILALLVVLVDSWANRPIKRSAPDYDEDY